MAIGLSAEAARRLGNMVWHGALVAGGLTALGGVILTWLTRVRARGLESHPDPATDYAGAVERLARLAALDDDSINPVCRSRGLLHGHRTRHAVILLHGLTNCPQQWARFGDLLHQRGVNVLLPRMPHHGLADRRTTDTGKLRAEELRDFGDRAIDIAAGLGDRVTIVGLSAGGIVAAWAAQYRPELAKAVLISPSLGFSTFGRYAQMLFMNVVLALPDVPTQRFSETDRAMPYAYIGWSSRALGEVLRLGMGTGSAAMQRRAAVQQLLVITNANDVSVNNSLTRQLISIWQAQGLQRVEYYEFDRAERLEHDLIDPNNPKQRVDFVYPILLDLITRDDMPGRRKPGIETRVDGVATPQNAASLDEVPYTRGG